MLQGVLLRIEGPDSPLARAIGRDVKGRASVVLYVIGIGLSFVDRWLGLAAYVVVALRVAGARPARVAHDVRARSLTLMSPPP